MFSGHCPSTCCILDALASFGIVSDLRNL
uniref:Uncharacterized protein n=1 Tax=Arundo donax TaxID=35708 RepID=A0A0A9ESN8_ARUDO